MSTVPQVVEQDPIQPNPPAQPEVMEPEKGAESAPANEPIETQPDKSEGDGQQRGIERRFAKLTAKQKEMELERDFWKAKALGIGEKPPTKAAETPQKPNPADFESTEAYLDARDEWLKAETIREARAELQKAESEREKKSEAEVFAEQWGEKEAALKEKTADYDEVTATAMETLEGSPGPGTSALAHALQFSEAGPELLYYLGQNPKEVQRLAQMHPTQAVIALGRIEARLVPDNAGGDQKPPMTRTPKPPTPVRKLTSTAVLDPDNPEDAEKMSPDEYWRAREAKRNRR